MDYSKLYLENIDIPQDVEDIAGEDGWECNEAPFFVNVDNVIYNGKPAVSYAVEFSPTDEDDFSEVNKRLNGFKPNGYGWTEYIQSYIAQHYSDFSGKAHEDSESETCCFYTLDGADFRKLLKVISECFRALS